MLHKKLHRQPQQDHRLHTYQGKKTYAANKPTCQLLQSKKKEFTSKASFGFPQGMVNEFA
jgi:hypothetical protein